MRPQCGSLIALVGVFKSHPGALAGELNTIRGQPLPPSVLPALEASDAEASDGNLV